MRDSSDVFMKVLLLPAGRIYPRDTAIDRLLPRFQAGKKI
jgi:hypothetical protein